MFSSQTAAYVTHCLYVTHYFYVTHHFHITRPGASACCINRTDTSRAHVDADVQSAGERVGRQSRARGNRITSDAARKGEGAGGRAGRNSQKSV